ncbi:hypothetical protein BH11ACT2_BH11ACT2_24350 [soil metagenome]
MTAQRWTWVAFVAAIVLTGVGAITGTNWVILLGAIVSVALIVVNSIRSSRARTGQTYSSGGSLFDEASGSQFEKASESQFDKD